MSTIQHVQTFLQFLGVEKQGPNLAFLNRLIEGHQKKVRWENLTKIVDVEKGRKTGNYLPPIEMYIERMTTKGLGGTCWSIAAGFHWLLSELGFDVHYLYMDSGHLCLRVDLDQPYYVDLGYCAPLFQAYPLNQSFTVKDSREEFQYIADQGEITVIRTPGPTKTLNPEPIQLADVNSLIEKSNHWATSVVLKEMRIFGYVEGVPTALSNQILKQYFPDGVRESVLGSAEVESYIIDHFGIDREFYREARAVFEKAHLFFK